MLMAHELVGQRITASDGQDYDVVNWNARRGFQVRDMVGRREWVPNLGPHTVVGDSIELSQQAPAEPDTPVTPAVSSQVLDRLHRIEMTLERIAELLEQRAPLREEDILG